jgi:predicted ABC-type sugar transport system permease subunit
MTFIILTGGIDLSVGSILGTTAVAAMVVSLIPELAFLSVPAALMLGLVLGLFNGVLVAFAGLPRLSSRLAPIRRCAARLTCWRTAPRSSTPVSGLSGSAITISARSRGWW